MNKIKEKMIFKPRQIQLILLMGIILIVGVLVLPVVADGLPPRDDPSSNSSDNSDDDDLPIGAYIELEVDLGLANSWSHVEWQDSNGDWQPVDGWAGTVGEQGHRRWWVDAKGFSKGPFRWVVSQGEAGKRVCPE